MKNLALFKCSNMPEEQAESTNWKVAFEHEDKCYLGIVKSYLGFGKYELSTVVDLDTLIHSEIKFDSVHSSKIFMSIDPVQYAENYDDV